MKVNSIDNIKVNYNQPKFRSEITPTSNIHGQDEFVSSQKSKSSKKVGWIAATLVAVGLGAFFTRKAGWWGKEKRRVDDLVSQNVFKKVDEAKEYFENLGINTIFRDVTDEHLPMLNRIKDDMNKLKELGVKFDKPDSLTVSDWHKAEEYEEFCRKRGVSVERIEGYRAFCAGDKDGANHVFINASFKDQDSFRHEMGHANHHRGHDSFWEAKGIKNHDFADKQLEILGQDIKIYRGTSVFNNIFHFNPKENQTKYAIPNDNLETRFVYVRDVLNKMQEETSCYKPDSLSEQVAYVFDGLVSGKKNFSDEVMLYYDFAGGARIPNLKINGKNYDEYIESLYNNSELIQKLKQNIQIYKL